MGTVSVHSNTLFGRTRGAALSIFYGHVGESFYLRQLARRTGIALGPVQREVRQLVDAGLVTRRIVGGRTLYSANQESPVFAEIKSLVTKTVGMHDVLFVALDPLRKKINLAFVYGSVARSSEMEQSDTDLDRLRSDVPIADYTFHGSRKQRPEIRQPLVTRRL